jgi:hypothetical protein
LIRICNNTCFVQESIPTAGTVKSYFIQLQIQDNPYDLLIPTDPYVADSIEYSVRVVNRPSRGSLSDAAVVIVILCLVTALTALAVFVRYFDLLQISYFFLCS